MPLASTEAIEPPPAPLVSLGIFGERSPMPNALGVCAANAASPPDEGRVDYAFARFGSYLRASVCAHRSNKS